MKQDTNEMEIIFDSCSENEGFARVAVASFMTQLNPTLEEVADVKTAISEAVTNAMIHGYRQEKGKIQMKCVLDLEEKVFQVTVKDTGVGIEKCGEGDGADVTTCRSWSVGDGVFVMEAFMDEVEVESTVGQGTVVHLRKRIGR